MNRINNSSNTPVINQSNKTNHKSSNDDDFWFSDDSLSVVGYCHYVLPFDD